MKVYSGDLNKGLNSSPHPSPSWELSSGWEDEALTAFTFYMWRLAWAGGQKAPCPAPPERWVCFPTSERAEKSPPRWGTAGAAGQTRREREVVSCGTSYPSDAAGVCTGLQVVPARSRH